MKKKVLFTATVDSHILHFHIPFLKYFKEQGYEVHVATKIAIGKMSFIGPRPWIPDYYDNMNEEQRHRTDIRPGLTDLAQCMGRNNITIIDKINYDLKYIMEYSLIQDLKIVFLIIKCVLTGSGADAGKSTIENELKA